MSLTVSLLGPLEVSDPDGPVVVEGAKRKALIALLALAAPRPVSADRLIDELWGDQTPANPANALQAQVSQVRNRLGREAVTRAGTGYLLAVDPSVVDASELHRLVAEGRAATEAGDSGRALEAFTAAAALPRGPALVDLADFEFARTEGVRLDALALDAQEGLAEVELASGNHAEVLPLLTRLAREHPLREGLHALLILALYRSGRQAEALRAYQAAREALVDELGIEPGPELQALERAVLAQDPALRSPVPSLPAEVPSLPTPVSSFVGREADVQRLVEALGEARLVSVVAVGGMGKTRLALEVAHRLADQLDVRFVELAPVTEAAAVPEAIAIGLGAPDLASSERSDQRSPLDRAADRLRDREVVVVLDNAEHVVGPVADAVTQLLRRCPGLRVVVTSRQVLGVAGERAFDLAPLAADDAARLFAERARAVQPHFEAPGAGDELDELCAHLDHLPLAIELAAARTRTLALPEITERLADRFRLLRADGRVGEGGHDGLRAAVDWSYESLFDEEREAFCRLAVFAGGATAGAVEAIGGPDAFDLVGRLADRSLVVADTTRSPARFHMLETLRAYGIERLQQQDRLEEAQASLLAWCRDLAGRAEPCIRTGDQLEWLRRLDDEHDNLRAALADAASRDPVGGLDLVGSLIMPWYFRGRLQEARHWAELCLERAVDAPVELRAKVLAWMGLLSDASTWTGRPGGIEAELALAEERAREAIRLLGADGDPFRVAEAHRMLAISLSRRASAGAAVDTNDLMTLLRETIERFAKLDDPYGSALLSGITGMVALAQGDVREARHCAEWARVHAERSQERFCRSRAAWLAALIHQAEGDVDAAYGEVERCLRLLTELGMEKHVTAQAQQLARLADLRGEAALAAQWRAFVAEREGEGPSSDDVATEAFARNREGLAHRARGDRDEARLAHLTALEAYTGAGMSAGRAFTESCLGFLAAEVGDADEAARRHLAALDAAVEASEPGSLALAYEGVAAVLADRGDPEPAARLLGGATTCWHQAQAARNEWLTPDVLRLAERLRGELGEERYCTATDLGGGMDQGALVVSAREALSSV